MRAKFANAFRISLTLALIGLVAACGKSKQRDEPAPPWQPAAIAHGGVGSPADWSDGCRAAVDAALATLEKTDDPLAAAVAGVGVMEDDERFNAGTGSRVRIDNATVQMDAAVMDSQGRYGAVAGVENVRHPVAVARAVVDTPHDLIMGDGATRLARALGMPAYDPTTDAMRAKTATIIEQLQRDDPALPQAWRTFDWRAHWNFERSLADAGLVPGGAAVPGEPTPGQPVTGGAEPEAPAAESGSEYPGSDTVAVAVRARDGRFAVAISTGGTPITLRGRVGDVPILGAGLFAGERGAVAATGTGELIVRASLSRRVYDRIAAGAGLQDALEWGVDEVGRGQYIGLIAITPSAMSAAADQRMAWAARALGSDVWLGPE